MAWNVLLIEEIVEKRGPIMLDFCDVIILKGRNGTIIRPEFVMYHNDKPVRDIMVKGGDFYAFWDEEKNIWNRNEIDCYKAIDKKIMSSAVGTDDEDRLQINLMKNSSSGMVEQWRRYLKNELRDTYIQLDSKVTFLNDVITREDYRSKRLPYSIENGSIKNWNRILSVLYDEEERTKIEWAIGAIVSGDSTEIQKFVVFYGPAGAGKSTIMNIIHAMFENYTCTFDSTALTSVGSQFSLEPFKNNPLVAIQQDGDMSKITDNSRLNSLVSHEFMNVNEKHKALYEMQFKAFLFVGTNRPVHITDPKSGLNRRLIDVVTSGRTLDHSEYRRVTNDVKYEYGAIAKHCLEVYLSNPDRYDKYTPTRMITATNDLFNYILDNYQRFVNDNSADIRTIWPSYKHWAEESLVYRVLPKREFREQLKDYFRDTDDVNVYFGFKKEKFEKDNSSVVKEVKKAKIDTWLKFKEIDPSENVFNNECVDCVAQYASDTGIPRKAWDDVDTKLKDLNTTEVHYVRVPKNHIVIDFDIPGENGEKDLARNIEAASKWPETYAELSKSGSGVHLHYIYEGDPTKLSAIYDDKVEIKVFLGKQALRRRLSLCVNNHISHISSGLPLKLEVKNNMVDKEMIQDEMHLRALIKKAMRKEIHNDTRSSVDFIAMALDKAYESGQKYDVSDMHQDVFNFASGSTHQASYCIRKVSEMKFKSDEPSNYVALGDDAPLCWFDIEVFPNLFLICYQVENMEDEVFAMINPRPEEIAKLFDYRLIGFNNRKYDNHLVYAAYLGYTVPELYNLSQSIIGEGKGFIGEAYNLSYTDIYDYMATKMSLKKLEYEMGIDHDELGYEWDKPVPEENWGRVVEYCKNDVRATKAAWYYTQADFTARQILADLAGGCPNDTTNTLTTRFIFGNERNPQSEFYYRDLSQPVYEKDMDPESIEFLKEVFPEMMAAPHGEAKSMLPYFPGYEYKFGKSTYLGEEAGEGGYAEGVPGFYTNCALLDVMSMHPHSAMAEVVFGPRFTKAFHQIVYGRVHIKHKAWEIVDGYLDGKLKPYIEKCKKGEMSHKSLANALKIAINSVYGLTDAKFDNPFRDPRNVDNIVAKRGALFMIELKHTLIDRGYTVAHIKTDSIKLPNATPELINFVMDFGKRYGYTFEHEATYEKMVLLNDAVYIARYATPDACEKMYGYVPGDNAEHADDHRWTATGTQFQIPFVFKKLFSKEPIVFDDLCSTFSVSKGALYLDMDENEDLERKDFVENKLKKCISLVKKGSMDENNPEIEDLKAELASLRHFKFVGRVGRFVPIMSGNGGGVLLRIAEDKIGAASGSKGFRWLESAEVSGTSKEDAIDIEYWRQLADKAIVAINEHIPYDLFMVEEPFVFEKGKCSQNCEHCPYLSITSGDDAFGTVADCNLPYEDTDEWRLEEEKRDYVLSKFCEEKGYTMLPF